tara:strand:- start:2711 stop:3220 length:510 start_codon:yes stop_codon:yes gene_type:complete
MATDPRYMSFDHQYVETVEVTDATNLASGVNSHRFVTRTGAYPAAFAYAAGATVFDIPKQGELTDKGYQVDNGTNAVYEGQLNPSTTPYKAGVFPYQKLLTVVTEGIVIVEVLAGQTIAVDGAVSADAAGKAQASGTTSGRVVLGRALDAVSSAAAGSYIRVKLADAIV